MGGTGGTGFRTPREATADGTLTTQSSDRTVAAVA